MFEILPLRIRRPLLAALIAIAAGCGATESAAAPEAQSSRETTAEAALQPTPAEAAEPVAEASQDTLGELPVRTEFRTRVSFNRHHANQSGADGTNSESSVVMESSTEAIGPLRVSDEGFSRRYFMQSSPHSVTETNLAWRYEWVGVAESHGGGVRLRLDRRAARCTSQETHRDVEGTEEDCGAPGETWTMLCTTGDSVDANPAPDPEASNPGLVEWRCNHELGDRPDHYTRFPWILRLGGCVQQSGGRGPGRMRMGPCSEEASRELSP